MVELGQTSTPQFKYCWQCRQWCVAGAFHKNSISSDGLHTVCKMCRAEWGRRYRHTLRGKEVYRKAKARYRRTNKGQLKHQAGVRKWQNRYPHYKTERYHRLQDEYGCHRGIEDWYPAARLLKALETAEIVEVKV